MDHYQDLLILPDPEFQSSMLMNALFSKLHRSFVRLENKSVGISFPNVDNSKPTLGDILRLHGNAFDLLRLQEEDWQSGMRDHMQIKAIGPVPDGAQYCRVKRVQAKSSAERLRRRYCNRHIGVTMAEAEALIPDASEKRLQLPYLQIKSESTGQYFRLFLEHETQLTHAISGVFNSYGLSSTSTVPWF
jgi:CRISPR-associated endonuclease Csy4